MPGLSITLRAAAEAACIGLLIVLLAALSVWVSPQAFELHNILHHLNFLPFMIAGLRFGWRGAGLAFCFALVLQTPIVLSHWQFNPFDAQDQVVELTIFGAAGAIAGFVSDRERMQRQRVEATKLELESVYTELRQSVEQMKRTERLSAAGQLAARLAHEIRNPLASISGAAGILKRGQASPVNRDECLNILDKESHRLNKLLTNFLDFARPRLPRFQPVEPASIVESVVMLARHSSILRETELIHEASPAMRELTCDSEQLKQVLLNLIINAVQAGDGSGVVRIRSYARDARLYLEVGDQGCGLPQSQKDQIFEPFFTTKESGTGLGLAIAANIVQQHGGRLTAFDNPDRGTTFQIELPFDQPPSPGRIAVDRHEQ